MIGFEDNLRLVLRTLLVYLFANIFHLKKAQLHKPSDVLIDQIRAIDNKRLIKKLGKLSRDQIQTLKNNIKVVLDL